MTPSLVTLSYALPWGPAVGSVSKDEACKTQKTVVSEAGARVKLAFAREESNSNTVPLSQQTATFIYWVLINNRNKHIQTFVRQWTGQLNEEARYVYFYLNFKMHKACRCYFDKRVKPKILESNAAQVSSKLVSLPYRSNYLLQINSSSPSSTFFIPLSLSERCCHYLQRTPMEEVFPHCLVMQTNNLAFLHSPAHQAELGLTTGMY